MLDPSRRLTRGQLLRATAGGAMLAGLGPLLAACGGSSEGGGAAGASSGTGAAAGGSSELSGDLTLWWWGEQEAAGIKGWVADTVKQFQDTTGVSVTTNLLDTDNVISQFTNAAAAGDPPDVQFLWNGIYHMENVWLGYLEPLTGLVSDEVLQRSGATSLSVFDGKQYRVGWYDLAIGLRYNKTLFDKAGLDADSPPTTWDAFMDALDKLKSSGVVPFGGGVKDGYFGEWWLGNALTQALDSPGQALQLFIGELDWQDPKYHEHWTKMAELKQGGYFNDDITSLELYQGTQLVNTGRAALTQDVSTQIVGAEKTLDPSEIGFMIMPVFGQGAMAGKPVLDAQGFGIASGSDNKEAAAALIEFMHSPEQTQAIYTSAKQIPADQDFDASVVDDPAIKGVYDTWVAGDPVVYIPNLMPTLFWTDAMFVASQKILAGEMDGDQAGELAAEITDKWKRQNPDIVEKYQQWGQELAI